MEKTPEEIVADVSSFIDGRVIPSCRTDFSKFRVGFAKPLVLARAKEFLHGMASDGKVDVSALKECVSSGFSATETVTFMDLKFDRSDADALFAILERGA